MTAHRVAPLLQAGTAVSRYRVVSFLGAGGMGEVYKARDPMLDRDVALKILPPRFLTTADAIHRFVHEAKTASALNHPHIVTIHEIGTADTVEGEPPLHYIAMELIDGQALREKIDAGLSLGRTLDLMIQIAEALSKAHGAGVIHRDLKPENVMVSHDGYAKVVDFGLAKLLEADAAADVLPGDVTSPRGLTRAGVMMGTVGYMAPEQIEGQPVDARSDIFSFGCVLYEAISGRQPFKAATISETLRRIVHDSPEPLASTNPDTPPDLERIVRKCLAKSPDERYQDMRDVAVDLREVRRVMSSGSTSGSTAVVAMPRRSWIGRTLAVLAVIALLIAAGVTAWRMVGARLAARDETYKITQITTDGSVIDGDVSPDGKYLAYGTHENGKSTLLLRQFNSDGGLTLLGPDDMFYNGVRFSSDGGHIYYSRIDRINRDFAYYRMPTIGGKPERLFDDTSTPVASSPDSTRIVFTRHTAKAMPHLDELRIANADGSDERTLASVPEPRSISTPAWSQDGQRLFWVDTEFFPALKAAIVEYDLGTRQQRVVSSAWERVLSLREQTPATLVFVGRKSPADQYQIWQLRIADGTLRQLTNDASPYSGIALPRDGRFILARRSQPAGDLWSVTPSGVRQLTSGTGAEFLVRCSRKDVLLYTRGIGNRIELRVRHAVSGTDQSLDNIDDFEGGVVPTPDGKGVVFTSGQGGAKNLWRVNVDGGKPEQLTKMQSAYLPDITPDGQTVIFTSFKDIPTIWRVPFRGGTPIQLTRIATYAPAVSPDGRRFAAVHIVEPHKPRPVVIFSMDGRRLSELLLPPTGSTGTIRWTPDGRSIAYVDTQQGVSNVWAMPLDGGDPRPLTSFTENPMSSFDFGSDGSVFCTRGRGTADLYLLEPEKAATK